MSGEAGAWHQMNLLNSSYSLQSPNWIDCSHTIHKNNYCL